MTEQDIDKLWFLLDTSTVSHLIREPQGIIRDRIAEVGEDTVCISVVVASELRFAAARRKSKRLKRQIETVLSVLPVLPLEPPVDEHYAEIRTAIEKARRTLGGHDLIIAAQARALGLTLVTRDAGRFGKVEGLDVEDWSS